MGGGGALACRARVFSKHPLTRDILPRHLATCPPPASPPAPLQHQRRPPPPLSRPLVGCSWGIYNLSSRSPFSLPPSLPPQDSAMSSMADKQLKQAVMPFAKFKQEEALAAGPQVRRRRLGDGGGGEDAGVGQREGCGVGRNSGWGKLGGMQWGWGGRIAGNSPDQPCSAVVAGAVTHLLPTPEPHYPPSLLPPPPPPPPRRLLLLRFWT